MSIPRASMSGSMSGAGVVCTTPSSSVPRRGTASLAAAHRGVHPRVGGEKRAYARAASLDPEFVESGLHTAVVWRDTEKFVHRNGGSSGRNTRTRRCDEVIREMRVLTDGIAAANVKRKHRLGTAILRIYRMLGILLHRSSPQDAYMRQAEEEGRAGGGVMRSQNAPPLSHHHSLANCSAAVTIDFAHSGVASISSAAVGDG